MIISTFNLPTYVSDIPAIDLKTLSPVIDALLVDLFYVVIVKCSVLRQIHCD